MFNKDDDRDINSKRLNSGYVSASSSAGSSSASSSSSSPSSSSSNTQNTKDCNGTRHSARRKSNSKTFFPSKEGFYGLGFRMFQGLGFQSLQGGFTVQGSECVGFRVFVLAKKGFRAQGFSPCKEGFYGLGLKMSQGLRFQSLQRKVSWFRAQNVLGFKVLVLAKKGFMVQGSECFRRVQGFSPCKEGFFGLGLRMFLGEVQGFSPCKEGLFGLGLRMFQGLGFQSLQRRVLWFRTQNGLGFRVLGEGSYHGGMCLIPWQVPTRVLPHCEPRGGVPGLGCTTVSSNVGGGSQIPSGYHPGYIPHFYIGSQIFKNQFWVSNHGGYTNSVIPYYPGSFNTNYIIFRHS